jgi:hypothetical protein
VGELERAMFGALRVFNAQGLLAQRHLALLGDARAAWGAAEAARAAGVDALRAEKSKFYASSRALVAVDRGAAERYADSSAAADRRLCDPDAR